MKITTIGVVLAKEVFQIRGVDEHGKVVLRKRLSRGKLAKFFANIEPCLICMRACGSSHHWARNLGGFEHTIKLMFFRIFTYEWFCDISGFFIVVI